jgi:hypothetical protein
MRHAIRAYGRERLKRMLRSNVCVELLTAQIVQRQYVDIEIGFAMPTNMYLYSMLVTIFHYTLVSPDLNALDTSHLRAILVRRNLGNTQPELHLLGSDRVGSHFCARVDEGQFLRVGDVVRRPLGVTGVDESVGIASNDDCK